MPALEIVVVALVLGVVDWDAWVDELVLGVGAEVGGLGVGVGVAVEGGQTQFPG